jgi:hypothetical protein
MFLVSDLAVQGAIRIEAPRAGEIQNPWAKETAWGDLGFGKDAAMSARCGGPRIGKMLGFHAPGTSNPPRRSSGFQDLQNKKHAQTRKCEKDDQILYSPWHRYTEAIYDGYLVYCE